MVQNQFILTEEKKITLVQKVTSLAYTISDPQFLHRKYTTLNNYIGGVEGVRGKDRLNEGKNHRQKKLLGLTLKANQPAKPFLCKGLDFSH